MNAETINTLNQYHISFIKKANGNKEVHGDNFIAGYLAAWAYWSTIDDIDDFLIDINKCINNQYDFNNNDVTMYSIHTFNTELTQTGLIFHHINNGIVQSSTTVPLQDMKILLLAWKDFTLNN